MNRAMAAARVWLVDGSAAEIDDLLPNVRR